MSNSSNTYSGIGIGGIAWVVLIILKLAGVIQMHWFWVLTSFIWISFIAIIGVLLIVALIAVISSTLK